MQQSTRSTRTARTRAEQQDNEQTPGVETEEEEPEIKVEEIAGVLEQPLVETVEEEHEPKVTFDSATEMFESIRQEEGQRRGEHFQMPDLETTGRGKQQKPEVDYTAAHAEESGDEMIARLMSQREPGVINPTEQDTPLRELEEFAMTQMARKQWTQLSKSLNNSMTEK